MKFLVFLLPVLLQISFGNAGNLLFLFSNPSKSHHILGEALAKGLVKRGHKVTMATPFPINDRPFGLTEISLDAIIAWRKNSVGKLMDFNTSFMDLAKAVTELDNIPRLTLQNPKIQELMQSGKTFDAVVIEPTLSDTLFGFAHFFKAPLIIFYPKGASSLLNYMVANSEPYAYVPAPIPPFTDEMTFLQRTANTLIGFFGNVLYSLFLLMQQKILHEYFPDAPPLSVLTKNVSLILLNAHYSVTETPRPYMPNMIQVAGIHIQNETLPEDIKRFLDGAKEGAVLFSLGSNLQSANLPQDKLDVFLKTFEKFPQRFLWKFEKEGLKVPKNVKISKWLPQQAVLAHPNTRAFITHGGILSMTEAVHYAVPFLGMPSFDDQEYNINLGVHRKIAVRYYLNNLQEETFTAAIKEILENPIYKENIAKLSELFRNQPIHPADLAVHWVEHVMKHRGAPYLQSAGVKLHWTQSYLLDVIAFIAVVVTVLFYVNFLVWRSCFRWLKKRCCGEKKIKLS